MLAVILATLSGLSYGSSDFFGAVAAKETDSARVTLVAQTVSFAIFVVLVATVAGGSPTTADHVWGGVAGLGVAVALMAFYRALAIGPMSTAAAITALVGAALPVVVGLALGEVPGPLGLVGVVLAIPAGVAVSAGAGSDEPAGLPPRERIALARRARQSIADNTELLSLVAGVGFGVSFVALARTGEDAGLWPLVAARVVSIGVVALVLTRTAGIGGVPRAGWWAVGLAGVLDCAANSFYLLALSDGSLTWVAAIVSLYPVATVGWARLLLAERLGRWQVAGLAASAAALALVAIGR